MNDNEALNNLIAECEKSYRRVRSKAYKKWICKILKSGQSMDSEYAEYLDGVDGRNGRLLYLYFSYIRSVARDQNIPCSRDKSIVTENTVYYCKIDELFFSIGVATVHRPIIGIKQCSDKFAKYVEL